MIKFGPNKEEFEKGDPKFTRMLGNRGAMFHIDKDQADTARETQKLLKHNGQKLLKAKDAKGFIANMINRIDRVFNQISNQNADELAHLRSLLVSFQGYEANEAMLKKLEKIHVRVLEIETQIYN